MFQTEAKMSARKTAGRRGTTKKRAQRATSNVFAMFDQAQIQEFKEAFNMIDQNRDGFVDKEDLHDMLASLGIYTFLLLSLRRHMIFLTLYGMHNLKCRCCGYFQISSNNVVAPSHPYQRESNLLN